jgi:polyhydroxyalkanoate synthase
MTGAGGQQPGLDIQAVLGEYRKVTHFLAHHPEVRQHREAVRARMSPTPRDLVFHEHSVALYHYRRATPASCGTPLLIVPSPVNKPSIMDLLKGESFIEAMLARGLDVYMLEWGEPTPAQKTITLHYFLEHYLGRSIHRILRDSGATGVSLAGYCLGGLFALLYTALDGGQRVRSLVSMVAPANFKDHGLLSWWADEQHFNVDKVVATYGNIPAEFFSSSFPWLLPTSALTRARLLYDRHGDPAFLEDFWALDIWITENTSLPGEVFRDLIKLGYQANVLVQERRWPMPGAMACLADVRVPVLVLAAQYDHVSPASSCTALGSLLQNAPCTTKVYPTSHLGIALGKDVAGARTPQYWDDLAHWLREQEAPVSASGAGAAAPPPAPSGGAAPRRPRSKAPEPPTARPRTPHRRSRG